MKRIIAISGASGFIGNALTRFLEKRGDQIIKIIRVTGKNKHVIQSVIDKSNIVINLAGSTILTRWSEKKKQKILFSRTETTRIIVSAINESPSPPDRLISASAIGIYDSENEHYEESKNMNDDFLAQVVKKWEKEAREVNSERTQLSILRFGIVLGKEGGMMKKLIPLVKFGLGALLGSGRQSLSFIHVDDVLGVVKHIIETNSISGIYNLVAPNPTTNIEFTKQICKTLHRPLFFRLPDWFLKLLLKEGAAVLTDGQKVYPGRLISEGFSFKYPSLERCLEEIIST